MENTPNFRSEMHQHDPDKSLSADAIFEKAFGGSVNAGQSVLHRMAKIDNRQNVASAIKKHMLAKSSINTTTGGAGTAGYALIPVSVVPTVVDRVLYETPFRNMFRRVACRGITYDYNARTARGGAHWKSEGSPQESDLDTYTRVSVPIKFAYAVGDVSGPAQAGMRGFLDPTALDLESKTQAMFELEEDTIFNGDATTYPTEFSGLIVSITTNTTNKAGDYVSLADIRTELATCFQARGIIKLAPTDAFTHGYIKGLLMDFQRYVGPAENVPFGIPGSFNFDGVDFIKSQFMPTASGSRRILFLDERYILMAVLQDITYQELAINNDVVIKYMMKAYEALVVTYQGCMSQIYGIL